MMRDTALPDLARAVARHLDGFAASPVGDYGDRLELAHPDGRRLWLHWERHLWDRVEIGGIYPDSDFTLLGADYVRITVATRRGSAVIAREITRRLLPPYTEILAKVQAHIATQAADHTGRAQVATRLAAIIPGAAICDDGRHVTTVHWSTHDGPIGSGDIELCKAGTTATLEARGLPVASLERLAELLAAIAASEQVGSATTPPDQAGDDTASSTRRLLP